VSEGEKKIVLNTGHIVGEATEPGCNFFNCCFREVRSVSTKMKTLELTQSKLVDSTGNPILVSAVVVYRVTEPLKALLQVTDLEDTLHTKALAVFRQIITKFPYESTDGKPCLTHNADVVNRQLAEAFQATCKSLGVTVASFSLNELSFSGEVAANMLQRQGAEALISARALITQGVASMTMLAIKELEKRNIRLKSHQQVRLAGNMLALLSGVDRD
jgi:regulator of protease activity HflC (stomatin/prohibitin superfamily)